MIILVTDTGFHLDDWRDGFVPLAAVSDQPGATFGQLAIDLSSCHCPVSDWIRLRNLLPRTALIRIRLCHIGDSAGYALATSLRRAGFEGRLRAHGAVLAGHYTLARRAGFTEIELQPHQARCQPREHWQNNDGWSPLPRRRPGQRAGQNSRPGP